MTLVVHLCRRFGSAGRLRQQQTVARHGTCLKLQVNSSVAVLPVLGK